MLVWKKMDSDIDYDGSQLVSHWVRKQSGLCGDAILAFCGAATVTTHMVDLEDRENKDFIYSPRMLHFILEHFHMPLAEAVARQRLLVTIIGEQLQGLSPRRDHSIQRNGDDLFAYQRKLSVSIATLSPVSALIHVGLNIVTDGTPVPTAGLAELHVDSAVLATRVMEAYVSECKDIADATTKVMGVL